MTVETLNELGDSLAQRRPGPVPIEQTGSLFRAQNEYNKGLKGVATYLVSQALLEMDLKKVETALRFAEHLEAGGAPESFDPHPLGGITFNIPYSDPLSSVGAFLNGKNWGWMDEERTARSRTPTVERELPLLDPKLVLGYTDWDNIDKMVLRNDLTRIIDVDVVTDVLFKEYRQEILGVSQDTEATEETGIDPVEVLQHKLLTAAHLGFEQRMQFVNAHDPRTHKFMKAILEHLGTCKAGDEKCRKLFELARPVGMAK